VTLRPIRGCAFHWSFYAYATPDLIQRFQGFFPQTLLISLYPLLGLQRFSTPYRCSAK